MMARQLKKSTCERLAACEAVGLFYWADHPAAGHVWAVDDHQQAHVVRIRRDGGTSQHVCRAQLLVDEEQCTGGGEVVRYTEPPGAA